MVELEDTYDLGSYIFVMCRFESCWGHWLRKQENSNYLTVFDWASCNQSLGVQRKCKLDILPL